MDITRNEIIAYVLIAIIVAGAAAYYASTVLSQNVSVTVKMVSLSGIQKVLYPFNSTNLRIYVNNTGTQQISGMLLGVYVNDLELQDYQLTIPPRSTAVINISYAYPSNGTYQFQAVADPGHLLNVQDRDLASSSFNISVVAPQVPDVYTSVPNNGITYSQHFILVPKGLLASLFISENFANQSAFMQISNNNNPLLLALYRDLLASDFIDNVAGAYTTYSNSSSSYVSWAQGLANLSDISYIVRTFGIAPSITTVNGTNILYARLNSTTSFCALYYRGWTKLSEYSNSSNSTQTCVGVASTQYASTESTKVSNEVSASNDFTELEGKFAYTNTTPVGRSLFDYGNSIAFMNMFESANATFAAYATRNPAPVGFTGANLTCYGYILDYENVSVCSRAVYPLNQSLSDIILVNTTEFNTNYTFRVLSLINGTLVSAETAHESAAYLINYLNVTGPNGQWKPLNFGACSFGNSSVHVGCNVLTFNYETAAMSMQLTNEYSNNIHINSIACFNPEFEVNQTVNQTMGQGQTLNLTTVCQGSVPGGIFEPVLIYDLALNYTVNNVQSIINGSVLINQ